MDIKVTSYTVEASMMIDEVKVAVEFTQNDRKGEEKLAYSITKGKGGGFGLLYGGTLHDLALKLQGEVARWVGTEEAEEHYFDFLALIENLSFTMQTITPSFLKPLPEHPSRDMPEEPTAT